MKKSIYLLGAGASYNAIPVVRGLNGRMLNMVQTYRVKGDLDLETNHINNIQEDTYREIYKAFEEDMNWLLSKADDVSIDTVAKEIFDNGNQNNELQTLKALLSSYITFEQGYTTGVTGEASKAVDPRYRTWFSKLFTKNQGVLQLPKELAVFTWNYDLQAELSNSERFPHIDLTSIGAEINVYPVLGESHDDFDFSKFFWYRLNGSASVVFDRNQNIFGNLVYGKFDYNNPAFLNRCLFIYSVCKSQNRTLNPNLVFAFEEKMRKTALNKAFAEIQAAESLTIIGYSFPHYNSAIDLQLFQSMPNLKKITIVDIPKAISSIRETLEEYNRGKTLVYREITDVEDFPVILS